MPSEGIVYRSGKKKLQKKTTKLSLADQIAQNRARVFSSNNYSARSGKSNKTGSDLESVDISHLTKQDELRGTPTPLPTVNPKNTTDREPVRKLPNTNRNGDRNIGPKEATTSDQNKTMPYQDNHMKQVPPPMKHNAGQRNRRTGSASQGVTLPPIQDNNKVTGGNSGSNEKPKEQRKQYKENQTQDYNNNARYQESNNQIDNRGRKGFSTPKDTHRREYSKERQRSKSPKRKEDKNVSSSQKYRSKSRERDRRRSSSRNHDRRRRSRSAEYENKKRSKSRERDSKYKSESNKSDRRRRSKSRDRNNRHRSGSYDRERTRRRSSRDHGSRHKKESRDRETRRRSKSPERSISSNQKTRRRSRSFSHETRNRSSRRSKSRLHKYRSKSRSFSRDRDYKSRHENKREENKRRIRSSRSRSKRNDDKEKSKSKRSVRSHDHDESSRSSSFDYHYSRETKNKSLHSRYQHDMSDTDDYFSEDDHRPHKKKQHRSKGLSERTVKLHKLEPRRKERKFVIVKDESDLTCSSEDEERTVYLRSKSQHAPRKNRKSNVSKEYYSDVETRKPKNNIVYYKEEPDQIILTPRNALSVPQPVRQINLTNNVQREEEELFYLVPASNNNIKPSQNQGNVQMNTSGQNVFRIVQSTSQNNTGQQYYVNKSDAVYGQEPMYDEYRQPVQQKFYNQHTNHYRHENAIPSYVNSRSHGNAMSNQDKVYNRDNVFVRDNAYNRENRSPNSNQSTYQTSNQTKEFLKSEMDKSDTRTSGRTPDGQSCSSSGQSTVICDGNESRLSSGEDSRVSTAERRRALKHLSELSNYNIDVALGKPTMHEPPMTDETLIKKIFNDEFQAQMDEFLRS